MTVVRGVFDMVTQQKSKNSILIVDDDPKIGYIFSLSLKLAGYEAKSVQSGREAIPMLKNGDFDLVLLDVIMPQMNGFEVLSAIRDFSEIPVIVFTARSDVFEPARQIGATDFIGKPLTPEALIKKIRNILNSTAGK